MFRINNYALTMALISANMGRTSAVCDGDISSFTGECNAANFQANLSGDCDINVLFPDVAAGEATIEEEIDALCAYDAPVQFVEIQGTYQKDRRYFAGGGPLVDGGDWDLDSAQLARFDANRGANSVIAWPEYAARIAYNANNELGANGYPANMNLEKGCQLSTAMCCFVEGDFAGNGDAATDVCRHDLYDSPQSNHIKEGWSVFPGSETATHCVGFTWNDGQDELIGNMLYDASLRNSLDKGYLKGVPGAPMCGCIENMPVVESAACRTATKTGEVTFTFSYDAANQEVSADNQAVINYGDCPNDNDLAAQYKANGGGDEIDEHLVASCADDLEDYLNDEQFLHVGQHPTKYVEPDNSEWSELIVGEGIYFQPPSIDPVESDTAFRALVDGGCKETVEGVEQSRFCIIRRICSSCSSEAHRDVYYKRYNPLPPAGTNSTAGEVYLLDMFMNNWISYMNNMEAGDFALFSSYEDALNDENAWTYCNYDYPDVGFPRDCGPTGAYGNQWNSYVRGGGYADHHGWYVERP